MKDKNRDRDASVDRLLAATIKARAEAVTGEACLDAETLAAWADGALDARDRARVEAHAADCARCQAMLATLVKTMPAAVAARSPWRLPALGWLVPLTAAATALVIWIAMPGPSPRLLSDDGVPAEPAASAPANAPANTKARAPIQADARSAEPAQPPGKVRERREAVAPEKPTSADTLAGAQTLAAASNVARAAPAQGAAPAAPAAEMAAKARAETANEPARLSAFANRIESVIVSSNPATRFQLLPGGGVQRSSDGGATWRAEVTGVTETLTAGSSPSPSVCWLVGPSGTVLLSTDGRSWRRLAAPVSADLRAVTATDDETATVTTVDGRAFATADGGRAWSRAPDR